MSSTFQIHGVMYLKFSSSVLHSVVTISKVQYKSVHVFTIPLLTKAPRKVGLYKFLHVL
jgi:hypothetical protein